MLSPVDSGKKLLQGGFNAGPDHLLMYYSFGLQKGACDVLAFETFCSILSTSVLLDAWWGDQNAWDYAVQNVGFTYAGYASFINNRNSPWIAAMQLSSVTSSNPVSNPISALCFPVSLRGRP